MNHAAAFLRLPRFIRFSSAARGCRPCRAPRDRSLDTIARPPPPGWGRARSRERSYNRHVAALLEHALERDPIAQFARWYDEARAAVPGHPEAMALATAGRGGRPAVRMVLMKDYDAGGFVFFTNYASRKAAELAGNARASLLFHWPALERQVRIEGRVTRVARRESDAYFATRPRGSQLSAWASPQSETVADRAALEALYQAAQDRHPGKVPRPSHWGGYRLAPDAVEFWQGREDRLHDRVCYRRVKGGHWTIDRLAP
ncbi:MAG: pyridoxamine 5'-phosphate oxidase [Burkholderiales bacterium]|nr:pyridoxamine 5'-phosphate oxidase [Burkholderiales bacterium]